MPPLAPISQTQLKNISFVGLGAIGAPMASHLANSFKLTVWNRTESKAAAFAASNDAAHAKSAPDAARGADVFITCLPTSADVEDVLFGPSAAAEHLARGSVVLDCTSGDPATARRTAERLAEVGVGFVDAPVSGGVAGARAGKLTVMCGGDVEAVERVRPVLDAFAAKVVLCGGVGAGDAVKAVNNALLAVHIWSAAEGLATLAKLGVDATVALDVINASSGRSNASSVLFPERVLTRAFPRTFRLALLAKDAGIAADMARETGTPADVLELTAELFRAARAELGEAADHVEAVKLVEQRAATTIGGRTPPSARAS